MSLKLGLNHPPKDFAPQASSFRTSEEEMCNYLNEKKAGEEFSLECHLTGFPGVRSNLRHLKYVA
jgi:hypothetical protein